MKYTKEQLSSAAKESKSVAETCRALGINRPGGSTQTHIRNRLRYFDIDTSHFLGRGANLGKAPVNRLSASDLLVDKPTGVRVKASLLRRALVEIGRGVVCELCQNPGTWRGRPLVLEIDHIDGNWLNNQETNLRFLCPNCHSNRD